MREKIFIAVSIFLSVSFSQQQNLIHVGSQVKNIGRFLNYGTVMSPDGKNLYVSSFYDSTLQWYTRNLSTGILTFGGSLTKQNAGDLNFSGISGLCISPDGSALFSVAYVGDRLTCFNRNVTTGDLTLKFSFPLANYGAPSGMNYYYRGRHPSISSDGKYIYTVSDWADKAVWFRNYNNDSLRFAGELLNSPPAVYGLQNAHRLNIGGIGTCGFTQDALGAYWFQIDTAAGSLSYGGKISSYWEAMATSPDDLFAYFITTSNFDTLSCYKKQPSGQYSFVSKSVVEGAQRKLFISPDGRCLYLLKNYQENDTIKQSIYWFIRDTVSGALLENGHIQTSAGNSGDERILISPDQEYLYIQDTLIDIFAINYFPDFISSLATMKSSSSQNDTYIDTVFASDRNVNDILRFSLGSESPAGMTVDSISGVIRWFPSNSDTGNNNVAVLVHDKHFCYDTLKYVIYVSNINDPPVIFSQSPNSDTSVLVGAPISFSVVVHDPDNQSFSYNWYIHGFWLSFNSDSFQTTYNANGSDTVRVVVSDGSGGYDTAQWIVQIGTNEIEQGGRSLPRQFTVSRNLPNPFNPSTSILIGIPPSIKSSHDVRIVIFSLDGRRIKTLNKSSLQPGYHTLIWDGKDIKGQIMPSGLYLGNVCLDGTFRKQIKMSLLK